MDNAKAPNISAPPTPDTSGSDEAFSRNILSVLAVIIIVAIFFAYESLETWAKNQEHQYRRRQLLAAYRQRHRWKKSDIRHLRSLDVNRAAQRRMERLQGRGRPVIKPPRPLDEEVVETLRVFQVLTDPQATSIQRKKAFRQWPWWSHYVEALYRGEYALAKQKGTKSPSVEAEIMVGRALAVSAATVHSVCGIIRRRRRQDPGSADFTALTVAEYESWMASEDGFAQARLGG